MKYKIFLVSFLIILAVVFLIFNKFHQQRIDTLIDNKYITTSKNIKNTIKQSLQLKTQQGLTLALSLAQNNSNIEFFESKNSSVDLKTLSNNLRKYTNQKNVWIHLVSKDGISLYRSWAKKKGDNVAKIRKELPPLLKNPKPTNLISVGIFDLTFKSIVPVYNSNKEFLGIVEVITKINSITDELQKLNYNPLVIVDKKYKKQIKKPFTKKFVDDYYVANINADDKYLKLFDKQRQDLIKDNIHYRILGDELAVTYHIKDVFGNEMAYFIVFEKLEKISLEDVQNIDRFIKILGIALFLLIAVVLTSLYLYNKSKYAKQLEKTVNERTKKLLELTDYHTVLFDKNPNIVFVAVVDFGIIEANSSFFKLFKQYKSLEEFNKEHLGLCDFALVMEDETYINPTKDWKTQITKPHRKLCLKLRDRVYHFRLESEVLSHHIHDEVYLITLTDITELILTQKDLEQQQTLIYQQSKNAAMGEMIGNISHQWRQPLSVISTGATGMKLQKELNNLSDEQFIKMCDVINDNAQYLSKTIDDFRDYIKGEREYLAFNLKDSIEDFLTLVNPIIKKDNIEVITNLDENITLKSYPNELIQCFINIFNNSKDAFRKQEHALKYVFIDTYKEEDNIIITFKDNGGGIPEEILPRIFEPYFTTKHQSQGTGLGLSITFRLITEGMQGSLFVSNTTYSYNNENYKGVEFKIALPVT